MGRLEPFGGRHVHHITTEGDPHTPFGRGLSDAEAIFCVKEKLHEPLRMAADMGVTVLLEPHGRLTDSIDHMQRLLHECDSPALRINLDTGNLWLGGGDPLAFIRTFGGKIQHVHWKDLPAEMAAHRGKVFGCGMATIPLGSGVVGIEPIFRALQAAGFSGHTTLEVAGEEAVLASYEYLKQLGAAEP